jgi:hypothetical protein
MIIREKIDLIYTNEAIHRFSLEDKASKVLVKFLEFWQKDKERYVSPAEVRRNFRTITSEDLRIILHEFEKMRLIVGKIYLAQFIYKFNDDPEKWTAFSKDDVENIVRLKNKTDEKLRKKFERSKKFVEDFQQKQTELDQVKDLSTSQLHEERSMLEIHEQDHVAQQKEVKECRLCQHAKGAFAQEDKNALGF